VDAAFRIAVALGKGTMLHRRFSILRVTIA
jgi:hypothetical protein